MKTCHSKNSIIQLANLVMTFSGPGRANNWQKKNVTDSEHETSAEKNPTSAMSTQKWKRSLRNRAVGGNKEDLEKSRTRNKTPIIQVSCQDCLHLVWLCYHTTTAWAKRCQKLSDHRSSTNGGYNRAKYIIFPTWRSAQLGRKVGRGTALCW